MKKVLAVVLALVLVFSLTACGGKGPEGSWKITTYLVNGEDALNKNDVNYLDKLAEKGFYFGLVVKSDKTATLNIMGQESTLKWDDKYFTSKDEEGNEQKAEYKIDGDTLTISNKAAGDVEMKFKRMTDSEAKKMTEQNTEELTKAILEIAAEMAGEEE